MPLPFFKEEIYTQAHHRVLALNFTVIQSIFSQIQQSYHYKEVQAMLLYMWYVLQDKNGLHLQAQNNYSVLINFLPSLLLNTAEHIKQLNNSLTWTLLYHHSW